MDPPLFIAPLPGALVDDAPIGADGCTGAVSRYDCPGGNTGEFVLELMPPIAENVVGWSGSATVNRVTTLLVTPPTAGPSDVSAPEPTWMLIEKPLPAVGPPARLGSPVRLPGRMLEIPPGPVM